MRRKVSWVGAMTMVLAGCGADSPKTPDTSRSTVSVKVFDYYDETSPQAGVDVVLSDSAGAPIGQAQTDAAGTASFEVFPGSKTTVTVFVPSVFVGNFGSLQTVVDAEPGDVLPFAIAREKPPTRTVGRLAVSFPPKPRGVSDFLLDLPCGAGFGFHSEDTTFDITQDCLRPGTDRVDVAAFAYDNDRNRRAFAVEVDVPVAPAGETAVRFPGGWRTDFAQLSIGYVNVPAAGNLSFWLNPERFGQTRPSRIEDLPVGVGAQGSWTGQYPNDFATGIHYTASFAATGPAGYAVSHQHYTQRLSTVPDAVSVDLGTLLPALGGKVIDTHTIRPRVSWTAAGDLSQADFGEVFLMWGNYQGSWRIMFPPTAASPVRPPELSGLASFAPPPNAEVSFFHFRFEDTTALSDYRMARTTYLSPFNLPKDYTSRTTYLQ
jgi:hypothetical protein